MKIRFVTFSIAKYGGIVKHIETKMKALKKLGHDVDIIILDYKRTLNINHFNRKVKDLENGVFQDKLDVKSQNGGYIKSDISGYWYNPYYGWLLEPYKNIIPCLDEKSLDLWKDKVSDCDLLIWSFVPTKTSEAKGFNWWHKYFELPKKVKQVLTIHDGYYDLRNSWTNFLKEKISFLECVHITSFNACEVFDIPRMINLDSRDIPKKMFKLSKSEREVDFFAAHIFKSMKRMEDLIASVPYISKDSKTLIAGSGIELYYMMTEDVAKQKPKYTVSYKTDPDATEEDLGKSLWKRAEESNGFEYLGLIGNDEVENLLKISKFAVDPSFSTHYAKYVNTHLNGFIIEAIVNGCYPILRNYRNDEVRNDFIFQNLRAIYIPHDVTPKEFSRYLNKAMKMTDKKYKEDTEHNYQLAKEILDPNKNMKFLIEALHDDYFLVAGNSNEKIRKDGLDVMCNFFKYSSLPKWML